MTDRDDDGRGGVGDGVGGGGGGGGGRGCEGVVVRGPVVMVMLVDGGR